MKQKIQSALYVRFVGPDVSPHKIPRVNRLVSQRDISAQTTMETFSEQFLVLSIVVKYLLKWFVVLPGKNDNIKQG